MTAYSPLSSGHPYVVYTARGVSWQDACSHKVIVLWRDNEHEDVWQGRCQAVGLRQGCPLSPTWTLSDLFVDDLHSQLQSDYPSAGVECRGTRIPSLFYADDVAFLLALAQGFQQLLDSIKGFLLRVAPPSASPQQRLLSLIREPVTATERWLVVSNNAYASEDRH